MERVHRVQEAVYVNRAKRVICHSAHVEMIMHNKHVTLICAELQAEVHAVVSMCWLLTVIVNDMHSSSVSNEFSPILNTRN